MKNSGFIVILIILVTPTFSKAADTTDLTGVYEGDCIGVNGGKPYEYRLSIKGSKDKGIKGFVEYKPNERELSGSCGEL